MHERYYRTFEFSPESDLASPHTCACMHARIAIGIFVGPSKPDIVYAPQASTASSNSPSTRRKRGRNGELSAQNRAEAHVDLTLDDEDQPSGRASRDDGDEIVVCPPRDLREKKQKSVAKEPIAKEDENKEPPAAPRPAIATECTICLISITKPAATKCGHLFCHGCISDWVKRQKT